MKVSDFLHEMRTTSAILGRSHGISVVFEGDEAKTNGKTIYLPSLDLSGQLTNEQVKAMRGYVDHEAGHIKHSDMPRIMDFYEKCGESKAALARLHNAIEDRWMERRVMSDYVGSEKNLRQTGKLVRKREVDSWWPEKDTERVKEFFSTPSHDVLGAGIVWNDPMVKDNEDTQKLLSLMDDNIREWSEKLSEESLKCENTEDAINLAKAVDKLLKDDPNLDGKPSDFDPSSGKGEADPDNAGEGKGEPIPFDSLPKEIQDLYKKLMEEGSTQITDEEDERIGGIGSITGDMEGEAYRVLSTKDDKVYKKGSGFPSRLQKNVDDTNYSGYEDNKNRMSSSIRVMKNKLRRSLMAKTQRRMVGGKEYGRLDSKRLVAAYNGQSTVYKQSSDVLDLDTDVTILIDLSGSMCGSKVRVARDCSIAISECLNGAGINFKVVGFSNGSRPQAEAKGRYHRYECTRTVVFKSFDEPLRKARGAINNIAESAGGNNSDYDFIQQELSGLKARDSKRKVLFVLSDGHPAHISDASDYEIIRHCKKAIKEGQKAGVECVGIGIEDSAVTEIYDNCVVVNNVEELSSTVFNKLTNLLLKETR